MPKTTCDSKPSHKAPHSRFAFYKSLQMDIQLHRAIRTSLTTEDHAETARLILKHEWAGWRTWQPGPSKLFRDFLGWAQHPSVWTSLHPPLRESIQQRKRHLQDIQSRKRETISAGRLNPLAFDKAAFWRAIPVYTYPRFALKNVYPLPYYFISKTQTIYERNTSFIFRSHVADSRIARKFVRSLDPTRLQHDVGEDDSGLFFDEEGMVLVVVRNACPTNQLIEFMDATTRTIVDTRTHIRKEDPGHLSQMGLSAGSRSASQLNWVKNIRARPKQKDEHAKNDYDASCAFALFWNLCQTILPGEIVTDVETFMESAGPDIRMDGKGSMPTGGDGKGDFTMNVGDEFWKFTSAHLAPLTGTMASNYARHVHREDQPHKWAVGLITSRSFAPGTNSVDAGGHFFLASHGIRVRAAANTLFAWRLTDRHATSLALVNSSDGTQEYHQRSMAFVTSNRLPNAIRKYRAGAITRKERDEEATEIHTVDAAGTETAIENLVTTLWRSARLAAQSDRNSAINL